jgi:hypothetical protein
VLSSWRERLEEATMTDADFDALDLDDWLI